MLLVLLAAGSSQGQAPAPGPPQPQQTQPQQPPQPAPIERNGVLVLIRSTLLALDQANKTGNYTVLRDLGAPGFQLNTAARLAEIFAKQRNDKVDLSAIAYAESAIEPVAGDRARRSSAHGRPVFHAAGAGDFRSDIPAGGRAVAAAWSHSHIRAGRISGAGSEATIGQLGPSAFTGSTGNPDPDRAEAPDSSQDAAAKAVTARMLSKSDAGARRMAAAP